MELGKRIEGAYSHIIFSNVVSGTDCSINSVVFDGEIIAQYVGVDPDIEARLAVEYGIGWQRPDVRRP